MLENFSQTNQIGTEKRESGVLFTFLVKILHQLKLQQTF